MNHIFVDGCRKKSGAGGFAWMARMENNIIYGGGFSPDTTNNIMELAGPLTALESLPKGKYLIYSDSKYFVDGFNQWMRSWKRNGWMRGDRGDVKNLWMWKKLSHLKETHEVKACWVRGHNGHVENELCDAIANYCCTNKISFKTAHDKLIGHSDIPNVAFGNKIPFAEKFGDVSKKPVETFIRMDANGRIYIKDGRSIDEYLNHPEQIAARKDLCLGEREMCLVTREFFTRKTNTYDASRES